MTRKELYVELQAYEIAFNKKIRIDILPLEELAEFITLYTDLNLISFKPAPILEFFID